MAVGADVLGRPHWMQKTDVLVSIGVLCIVIMMVIPLPPFILDLFIAANLTIGIAVILTTMYILKAVEFTVYPSLLLIVTVYRLALNVSSTRMILLGRGEEIGIIKAFGTFVIGGNYVVGIIIFLILVMIQFMVVVRGTTRVSEVAARFTLDAMPGKQMAIDADLNAGLITEQEAIERRMEIRKEADFYGAMDGACKFVQGDVMAGLVITIINIIGGLIIAIWILKLEPMAAVKKYTILTVGDGLVAQIPSLLISVATGLLVTRAASEANLGTDLTTQLTAKPKVLWIVSGALAFLAITPLPTLPLLTLSGGSGFLAYVLSKSQKQMEVEKVEAKKREEVERAKRPESVMSLLQVDPMELEIGYSLIPLVDPEQGGDLLDRVTMIRRQMAMDLGLVVPPIRIRDNMQLRPDTYVIKIKGVEVAKGGIKVDHYLAMNPGTATEEIEGEKTIEPAFKLPAIWITEAERERAEMAGYTVVDAPSIVATHLTEVIRRDAPELLGRQEVQTLLDNVKQKYPTLVDELVPNVLTVGEVQKVLHSLLKEGVSIRNLVTILEVLADFAPKTKEIPILTEQVRIALARQICNQYKTEEGILPVITLDPTLEETITKSIKENRIVLEPATLQKILSNLSGEMNKAALQGYQALVLCSSKIRRYLKDLTIRNLPTLAVLSYDEIIPDIEVRSVGMVRI
ncbi:MAG: flagellar biosynthesis protein FlhA [bacterium]|nr:flagellar biosynthesis protein FlhA [bacterium]